MTSMKRAALDAFTFRPSRLRNVELTAPYMHDGSIPHYGKSSNTTPRAAASSKMVRLLEMDE